MYLNQQTILVVDDEVVFVQSVRRHILKKDAGYQVRTAYNGREALEILTKEKIDLAILDIKMPVMDGIRVLAELHNRNIWLPIIVLTNIVVLVPGEEGAIFGEFGIADYLEKPVNLDKLDKKIEEISNRPKDSKKTTSGIDLFTILRVVEMEKRTGIMTIDLGKRSGKIFFREGDVMDAEVNGFSPEEALLECLRPGNGMKKISIEYIHHRKIKKIYTPLSGVYLKASLMKDKKT